MSELTNNIEKDNKFSGEIRIRMPKSLHKELSNQAKEEGTSLNQYIIYKLSKNTEESTIKQEPFFINLAKRIKEILESSKIDELGNLTLKEIKTIIDNKYKDGLIQKETYDDWKSCSDALKLQALLIIKNWEK